jgi:hypothetical protein
MPALSHDTLMERETTIRFDETGEDATLWTASIPVKREWESLKYDVKQMVPNSRSWIARVPVDRIGFKPLKRKK